MTVSNLTCQRMYLLRKSTSQVGSTIIDIAYGFKSLRENDPLIMKAEEALSQISIASVPGAFLVDILPLFKYVPEWFPGAEFKRKAHEWKKTSNFLLNEPINKLKGEIVGIFMINARKHPLILFNRRLRG